MSTAIDIASLLRSERKKILSGVAEPSSSTKEETPNKSVKSRVGSLQAGSILTLKKEECLPGLAPRLKAQLVNGTRAAYYVPNFITEEEEQALISNIYDHDWVQLKTRRLQYWGGLVGPNGLQQAALPQWLSERLQPSLSCLGVFTAFNHVLINEYTPGQGIMPHEDGPLYLPRVAILSLRSPGSLHFTPKQAGAGRRAGEEEVQQQRDQVDRGAVGLGVAQQMFLEPRSLLIFEEDLYTRFLHGMPMGGADSVSCNATANFGKLGVAVEGRVERATRVSLTIRVVARVFAPEPSTSP
mmetsp:Transcript_22620/g.56751  ORF Transcript_22620/g.56751 Transcript_22620/m.56751 type:complete len:298 (+) Transcript_22620:112-1005(+)